MVETKHVPDQFILVGQALETEHICMSGSTGSTDGCGQTESGRSISKLQLMWSIEAN